MKALSSSNGNLAIWTCQSNQRRNSPTSEPSSMAFPRPSLVVSFLIETSLRIMSAILRGRYFARLRARCFLVAPPRASPSVPSQNWQAYPTITSHCTSLPVLPRRAELLGFDRSQCVAMADGLLISYSVCFFLASFTVATMVAARVF